MASTETFAERLAVVRRTGAMLQIDDAMLTIGEDLDRQIEVRKRLHGEMVGNLYPGVIVDELVKLIERRAKLKRWDVLYKD